MVIDFHTHCFADNIAANAMKQLKEEGDIEAFADGTAGGLLASMKTAGIDKSVVVPVATKPSQVAPINKWAKQATSESLCFFGALHPDDESVFEQATWLADNGFKGVKFHPDYQRFLADEPRMMPIYEALRDLNLIVLLHAGVDIGLMGTVHCTPLMIDKVIKNVPGLKLVAAHMGGHGLWQDAEEMLSGKDLFFDTSYSWYELQKEGMTRMISKHGTDKILFGTDSPWTDSKLAIERIVSLDLPSADMDKILYKNAQDLLK